MNVDIHVKNNDFSDREKEILKALVLQFGMLSNIRVTGGTNMAINPVESENADSVFHMDFCFQDALDDEKSSQFQEELTKRVSVTFEKMLKFGDVETLLSTR